VADTYFAVFGSLVNSKPRRDFQLAFWLVNTTYVVRIQIISDQTAPR